MVAITKSNRAAARCRIELCDRLCDRLCSHIESTSLVICVIDLHSYGDEYRRGCPGHPAAPHRSRRRPCAPRAACAATRSTCMCTDVFKTAVQKCTRHESVRTARADTVLKNSDHPFFCIRMGTGGTRLCRTSPARPFRPGWPPLPKTAGTPSMRSLLAWWHAAHAWEGHWVARSTMADTASSDWSHLRDQHICELEG